MPTERLQNTDCMKHYYNIIVDWGWRLVLAYSFLLILAAAAPAQTSAPPFAIVCLDDSSMLISNESIKGKYYLIDFWATWCPPCVEEIPELSRVYEKYKGRKLEVLSLSFDKSPLQIQQFRKTKKLGDR